MSVGTSNNIIGLKLKEEWSKCKKHNAKLEFCLTWHPMTNILKYFSKLYEHLYIYDLALSLT